MEKLLKWCKVNRIFRIINFVVGFVNAFIIFALFFYENRWVRLIVILHGIVWLFTYIATVISFRIIKCNLYKTVNKYLNESFEIAMLVKIHFSYDIDILAQEYTLYLDDDLSTDARDYISDVGKCMEAVANQTVGIWLVTGYQYY